MIIVSFIFVTVCGLDLSQICPGFLLLLLLYLCCWRSNYQARHGWDPLTSLNLPHFCAYTKLGPGVDFTKSRKSKISRKCEFQPIKSLKITLMITLTINLRLFVKSTPGFPTWVFFVFSDLTSGC